SAGGLDAGRRGPAAAAGRRADRARRSAAVDLPRHAGGQHPARRSRRRRRGRAGRGRGCAGSAIRQAPAAGAGDAGGRTRCRPVRRRSAPGGAGAGPAAPAGRAAAGRAHRLPRSGYRGGAAGRARGRRPVPDGRGRDAQSRSHGLGRPRAAIARRRPPGLSRRRTSVNRARVRQVLSRHGPAGLATVALLLATLLTGIGLLGLSGGFLTGAALTFGVVAGFNLFLPSAGIRALTLARIACRYGEKVVGHEATLRIARDLRVWLFERMLALSPGQLSQLRTGDLLARLLGDIDAVDGLLVRAIGPLLALALAILALAGFAFALDPLLG